MPVVESYPSIVGIAQVAQSAGQGRYNQWLAEYNARSNQMKTNALMSGFQVGSNLGMSTARMWQQQQQFAERQGQFESQAAQRLQKDTEHAAAMTPALTPYLQRLYPHATDQEIGAMIGSMDRNQIEGLSNTITNAGRASAWHDMFRSPQALRREAENTYRNLMNGREHHNARVQERLKPIHDRLRNADFAFDESAIQGEIARILQEEGSAGPTTNPQSEHDRNVVTVYGADGQPAYKYITDKKGALQLFDIREKKTRGAGGTPEQTFLDVDKATRIVDARHEKNLEDWKRAYGGYDGEEPDRDQVATYVAPTDGTMWRRARPGERYLDHREINGQVTPVIPATIPPRPTREGAKRDALRDNPLLRDALIPGARPSEIGAGVPTPRVFAGGRPAELRRGDATPGPGAVQPSVQPQGPPGAQPGQVMPQPQIQQPQRASGLPTTPVPLSPELPPSTRSAEDIQVGEEARAVAIRKIRGGGQLAKPGGEQINTELGVATHRGMTELIGSEGREKSSLSMDFEMHVRRNGRPEEFASRIMTREEVKSQDGTINDFDGKLAEATAYAGKPGSPWHGRIQELVGGPKFKHPTEDNLRQLLADWRKDPNRAQFKMKQAGFTETEVRSFHDTHAMYDRKRTFATTVAAAAVKSTPPGQRPDIANIPIMDQRSFEIQVVNNAVQPGEVFLTPRDGVFIVTRNAIAAARQSYLLREHGRNQPIGGFPNQPAR